MNVASARSAWARTAIVMPGGTRWRTTTVAPWYVAMASAKRIASSAWGPPRTGTRTRLMSRDAALLDDGDVARRLADDLVDGRREDRRAAVAPVVAGRRLAAPAEDDEVGLLLGGRLDDALGGVPPDAHDRVDRRAARGRSRGPSGAAAGRAGRGSRPRTAASPRAPRRCPARTARRPAGPASPRRAGSAPRPCPGWRPG